MDKEIFKNLVRIESEVVGLNSKESKRNARMNYVRALATFNALLPNIKKQTISCLNLSGLGAGHQDLALFDFLKNGGFNISGYTIVDSELNPFVSNDYLNHQLSSRGQNLLLNDYTIGLPNIQEKYDLIFVCEIIEHLDYSDVLNVLHFASSLLNVGGQLVVTTPNQFGLLNRLSFLFGKDNYFDLDVSKHRNANYFGHIGIFSNFRVEKLLMESSLIICYSSTFNHWRYSLTDNPLKYVAGKFLELFTGLFNLGFTLIVVAKKEVE